MNRTTRPRARGRATKLLIAVTLLLCSICCVAQTVEDTVAELRGSNGTPGFVEQPDGKLIVFGLFDRIGGVARRNIARFNADGSLDTGWAPDTNGWVRGVVVDADGSIFVSGEFSRLGGRDVPKLLKLFPGAEVRIDSSFTAELPEGTTAVNAPTLRDDGGLFASYSIGSAQGVLKLDARGAADPAFTLTANNLVLDILPSQDGGSLFVAGFFSSINGTTTSSALAKVSATTGTLDPGWAPLTGNTSAVRVRDMQLDGSGHLLLAGLFQAYPSGFVRVQSSGTGTPASWGPAFTGEASPVTGQGLARFPDGDVLAVGSFDSADGQPRPAGVARLAPDGVLRSGWGGQTMVGAIGNRPNGIVSSAGVATIWRFNAGSTRARLYQLAESNGQDLGRLTQSDVETTGAVSQIVRQPGGGRLLLGGSFLFEIDGRHSAAAMAIRDTLQADASWASRLTDKLNLGGTVTIGAGTSSVFAGGFGFDPQASTLRPGLVRLDGSTGALVDWDARASATTAIGNIVPGSIAVDDADGYVYITAGSGSLRDAGNATIGNGHLLRFALADGIADLSWNPAFTGSGNVATITTGDGYLYYAGSRNATATDGSAIPSLARMPLAGNGRADPTWQPFTATLTLRSMKLHGSYIYVGGDNVLKRVDRSTGVVDSAWVPAISGTFSVRGIEIGSDGALYVTGSFPADCLGDPTSVLRLLADGRIDAGWGIGADGAISAALELPDGSVLLGGAFRTINGQPRTGLAHLQPSAASEHCSVQTVAPVATTDAASIAPVTDASGRYVAFQSLGSTLEVGDSDGSFDIYRIDTRCVGGVGPAGEACTAIVRASVDDEGAAITGDAVAPSMSADGQLLVFVAADAGVGKLYNETAKRSQSRRKGGGFGIFLRDMLTGRTSRVGDAPGMDSRPQISPTGTVVTFPKPNSPTDPGTPGQADVYVAPIGRLNGVAVPGLAQCVSCKTFDAGGTPTVDNADGDSMNPVLSADGTWIAWQTTASNMLPTASPCAQASSEILLRNLLTGSTQRVGTPASAANCGAAGGSSGKPAMDYSGTRLVFESTHALESGANGADVYFLDTRRGSLERVSRHFDGGNANGASGQPSISGDGETIAFVTSATDIDAVDVDTNGVDDIIVYSARERLRRRLARAAGGAEADQASLRPALNYTGSAIVFDSAAGNLGDDAVPDRAAVYVRANPTSLQRVFSTSFE